MNEKIQILPNADAAFYAVLTTEHSSSSHGLPVVVIDGQAYGPADLEVRWPKYQVNVCSGDVGIQEAAAKAGYRVYVETLGKS